VVPVQAASSVLLWWGKKQVGHQDYEKVISLILTVVFN
jgi:hypothetical protein